MPFQCAFIGRVMTFAGSRAHIRAGKVCEGWDLRPHPSLAFRRQQSVVPAGAVVPKVPDAGSHTTAQPSASVMVAYSVYAPSAVA
jgi:hypothetical protein